MMVKISKRNVNNFTSNSISPLDRLKVASHAYQTVIYSQDKKCYHIKKNEKKKIIAKFFNTWCDFFLLFESCPWFHTGLQWTYDVYKDICEFYGSFYLHPNGWWWWTSKGKEITWLIVALLPLSFWAAEDFQRCAQNSFVQFCRIFFFS